MPTDRTAHFPLVSIKTHPRFTSIRGATSHGRVRDYARAMINGDVFPPILLAENGGNLYVVDGHHRFEAAQVAGLPSILGIRRRLSLDAAHLLGLQANTTHGKPMSNTEKASALHSYVDAGLHRFPSGSLKSFRRMAQECPVYTFQSIRRKLLEWEVITPDEDDRNEDEYHHYRLDEDEVEFGISPDDLAADQATHFSAFLDSLDAAMTSYGLLDDEVASHAYERLKRITDDLRSLHEDPLAI